MFKNFFKNIIFLLTFIIFLSHTSISCSLWAATGDATDGNVTMIVKNRDWKSNHYSNLMVLTPEEGYRVLALYSTGGDSTGIKAGVNEKGLTAVNATASVLSEEERGGESGLLDRILFYYDSVDSVLADKELLSRASAGFCMIGDKDKIAIIEVVPDGNYTVHVTDNGYIFHTNHYLDEGNLEYNKKENYSSHIRYERLKFLLESHEEPFTEDYFLEVIEDQNDGPDNSLWRTGSTPEKTKTLGTWFVTIGQDGIIELYAKILNTPEGEKIYELKLDEKFWNSGFIQEDKKWYQF